MSQDTQDILILAGIIILSIITAFYIINCVIIHLFCCISCICCPCTMTKSLLEHKKETYFSNV